MGNPFNSGYLKPICDEAVSFASGRGEGGQPARGSDGKKVRKEYQRETGENENEERGSWEKRRLGGSKLRLNRLTVR